MEEKSAQPKDEKVQPGDPEVRWDKVNAMRDKIKDGTYPLDENIVSMADRLAAQL